MFPHKKEQHCKLAFRLRPLHEFHIGTGRQRRFKCKILAFGQKIVHSLQHQPSGPDHHAFGIERRQPLCYFVGIDELPASQHFGQHGIGCSRFPCTVATRYDIEFRHTS